MCLYAHGPFWLYALIKYQYPNGYKHYAASSVKPSHVAFIIRIIIPCERLFFKCQTVCLRAEIAGFVFKGNYV